MTTEDDALRQKARDLYCDSSCDIEIDDDAKFSQSDTGTWVAAWVFVHDDKDEE